MATIVFDLDGTLADTSADLIAAANAVFRAEGHEDVLDPQRDALTAFRGGRAMLTLGYERLGRSDGLEAKIEAGYPILLSAYGEAINVHTRMYPGAVEAVQRALKLGYRTAICTNKPQGLAESLLDLLGVRELFGSLIGADTLAVRKPDPEPFIQSVLRAGGDPNDAILIGDTETDRETARAAGVPCVLVSFGPGGAAVAEMEPAGLLDHYDDLETVLAPLLPPPS